jgi:sulfur-carrier protein
MSPTAPAPAVNVELTTHLFTFFPDLKGRPLRVHARTAAEVVAALDRIAPGIASYICDERGRLRSHVNLFIGNERVSDRAGLSDPVPDGSCVTVMQSLSGG